MEWERNHSEVFCREFAGLTLRYYSTSGVYARAGVGDRTSQAGSRDPLAFTGTEAVRRLGWVRLQHPLAAVRSGGGRGSGRGAWVIPLVSMRAGVGAGLGQAREGCSTPQHVCGMGQARPSWAEPGHSILCHMLKPGCSVYHDGCVYLLGRTDTKGRLSQVGLKYPPACIRSGPAC